MPKTLEVLLEQPAANEARPRMTTAPPTRLELGQRVPDVAKQGTHNLANIIAVFAHARQRASRSGLGMRPSISPSIGMGPWISPTIGPIIECRWRSATRASRQHLEHLAKLATQQTRRLATTIAKLATQRTRRLATTIGRAAQRMRRLAPTMAFQSWIAAQLTSRLATTMAFQTWIPDEAASKDGSSMAGCLSLGASMPIHECCEPIWLESKHEQPLRRCVACLILWITSSSLR